MLKELTSEQLTEWMAFNKIDPIGKWRDDFRMSYLATIISNNFIQAFGKKGNKLHKIDDFILHWEGRKQKVMSQKQLTEALMAWATTHNAAIEKREKQRKAPQKDQL